MEFILSIVYSKKTALLWILLMEYIILLITKIFQLCHLCPPALPLLLDMIRLSSAWSCGSLIHNWSYNKKDDKSQAWILREENNIWWLIKTFCILKNNARPLLFFKTMSIVETKPVSWCEDEWKQKGIFCI